jgi:hypothetical protein
VKCLLLLSFFSAFCRFSFSQNATLHHPELQFVFEDSLLQTPSFHSAFRPLHVSQKHYQNFFYNDTSHRSFLNISKGVFRFAANPVLTSQFNYSSKTHKALYKNGVGVHAEGRLFNTLSFDISAQILAQTFGPEQSDSIGRLKLVQGYDRPWKYSGNVKIYPMLAGSVSWMPMKYVALRAGYDKHFWGDGYRSLFLSENAAPYPFLQLNLNVWKIQYTFQTLFLSDVEPGFGSRRSSKYISMHQLSYNIASWLNVYAFEAVVWQAADSLRYRGMDVHYLNPFMLFRPEEYNLGSPDNMLFGLGGRLRVGAHSHLYGQILLDEFRWQELTSNKGWWGNKYGLQAGFKTFGLTVGQASLLQMEVNHITPFTYSHTTTLENYGYLNMPLAHPYGCNIDEALLIFRVAFTPRNYLYWVSTAARYGRNPTGKNLGGDIYKPMWTFENLYGNTTGQGITFYDFNQSVQYSYLLQPVWHLSGFVSASVLARRTEGKNSFYPAISLGFKTLLYE